MIIFSYSKVLTDIYQSKRIEKSYEMFSIKYKFAKNYVTKFCINIDQKQAHLSLWPSWITEMKSRSVLYVHHTTKT